MANYFSNIEKIEKAVKEGEGFDYIIIVSSDKKQADFWQKRLSCFKKEIFGKNAEIISQYEDWGEGAGPVRTKSPKATAVPPMAKRTSNGAGQLLGTLYAFQKANQNKRLENALKQGKSVAIYHTAGKGKRMAPLTFSEGGNKSAIRLPKILKNGELFTILEAVIFQTQVFAKTRPGRLCVFWGDQIIIPSENFDFEQKCHGEIFGIKDRIPTQENIWKRDWQPYGLLALAQNTGPLQREKLSWEEFCKLKKSIDLKSLSKSLGFFSWSQEFLKALLGEFENELREKNEKLDTDFHLWMPLTSTKEEFLERGGNGNYWERIDRFKKNLPITFFRRSSEKCYNLVLDKDLGKDAFWWDFGQISFYHKNLLKALENSLEGKIMRRFFNIEKTKDSILVNSRVAGNIKNSLIINSEVRDLKAEGAIIVNSKINNLISKNVLVYNLKDFKDLEIGSGTALCGMVLKDKRKIAIETHLKRDGKEDWEKRILDNPYSYKELETFLIQDC
ncbi:MAG: hypothetical protein COV69_02550 [Parcubacteria group bacterium CG11_big_fil_rev_8_21_14_0_20_39_14]|nr:MAG: hypothetical protein COV69_02550 [Parcubacteria group bacterium CG11_big_fil_rev_8_21_14_0_20_39_14]PIS34997.1 MAG: hypothetical protein COT36_04675 [Parcubacteria group bacterium CG08_land_8_20_14_0_20_38_56]